MPYPVIGSRWDLQHRSDRCPGIYPHFTRVSLTPISETSPEQLDILLVSV